MVPSRYSVAAACFLLGLAGSGLSQEPSPLASAWEFAIPNAYPQAIAAGDAEAKGLLYVALKNGGLGVFDTSSGEARAIAIVPTRQLGRLDVMHVAQRENLLYLALGDFFRAQSEAGVAILDVSTPRRPAVVSVWTSAEKLNGAAAIAVDHRYVYLGAMRHGVLVFDAADPAHIEKVAEILPDANFPRENPNSTQHPNARGLAIDGQYLYVANDAGGLRVIDIANPVQPKEVSRYINAGMGRKQQAYNNLVIDGTTAYVAVDYAGLEILDIADPYDIKQIAWWNPWEAHTLKNLWINSPGHTNQIAYDPLERRVYLSAGASELLVVDAAEPADPKLVAVYGQPGQKAGAWGLALSPGYAYLAYIRAVVPFQGTWSGLKAIQRGAPVQSTGR